ncbi:beta-ketoacyl synthase N-terminal-like domain-containing protein [Amycolatopsis sp. NPDC003676]
MNPVVITGLGVVAPNGVGTQQQWKATLAKQSGIAPLPAEVHGGSGLCFGGQVPDFDPDEFVLPQQRVQTDRWTWFCLAAAQFCFADAELDLDRADPYCLSVVTPSSTGGNVFGQRELQSLWSQGPRAVTAYQSIAWFYAASAGQLSIRHGLRGRCAVTAADGAGGLAAAGAALRMLRTDPGQRILVAGGEAPFSPYSMVCHQRRPDLSRSGEYQPFRTPATGGVLGEGGAALLVETLESATARNAPGRYCELAAVVSTHDAHDQTQAPHTPGALVAAITRALRRADVAPDEVDVVFADGNGAADWDRLELAALRACFGDGFADVPVAVPKTMTGRLNSAGALLDLCWAAQALAYDIAPPALGGADGPLAVTGEPCFAAGLNTALVIARGAGGFNAAAVLKSIGGRA